MLDADCIRAGSPPPAQSDGEEVAEGSGQRVRQVRPRLPRLRRNLKHRHEKHPPGNRLIPRKMHLFLQLIPRRKFEAED